MSKNSSEHGYFSETVKGVKSIVIFGDKTDYGWRFVRIIPWTTIFSNVEKIRMVTLFISFGILILGYDCFRLLPLRIWHILWVSYRLPS